MSQWHPVGAVSEIIPDKGKYIEFGEKEIALFQINGSFFAIDNRCPHRGGPLFRGALEGGPSIRCPLHGWLFDLKNGQCLNQSEVKLVSYAVKVDKDKIYICMESS